jgi:cytochrome bd-type quinol oxidase subunit 2
MLLKPNVGRALSAVGALVVVLALFMTWYHIDRAANADTTGWQTFPHLRIVLVVGAVVVAATALVAQARPVLVLRAVLGVVLAILILRRIVFPPDLSQAVSSQVGVYVGLAGAVCVALGGLVDTGREVLEAYPTLWRPAGELGPGRRTLGPGDE